MSLEEIDRTIEECLLGTRAPNGNHDAGDIFWLMAWADWSVERDLLREQESRAIRVTPQAESVGGEFRRDCSMDDRREERGA